MAASSVCEAIAREAEREGALWGAELRAASDREDVAVFSPLADERFAVGLETIYEGYLLHYGRARLFRPGDGDARVLVGDYLYAQGLVRVAALGETAVVANLAELLSLCAELRAEGRGGDGAAWAGTVALLATSDGRLEAARAALRERHDPGALDRLARAAVGDAAVARALALHAERVA